MFERTAEGAFALLRPVLQELKVQHLKIEPVIVKASSYKELIIAGMEKWIIVARHFPFNNNSRGLAKVIFDKTHNLFILFICIDRNLFINDGQYLRKQRKMVAIHEFVHGSAHMFLESYHRSERYIEFMEKSIIEKVKMTYSNEFIEMLAAIGKLGSKDGTEHDVFTDGHFRLLKGLYDDGFDGNFVELYIYFLLSYQLIFETMTAIKIQHEATGISMTELLVLTFNELVENKALDNEFVIKRMGHFLPKIYADFL